MARLPFVRHLPVCKVRYRYTSCWQPVEKLQTTTRGRTKYEWLHMYGFARPATGETFTAILPRVRVKRMADALAAFAANADPEGNKVVDNARWHWASTALLLPQGSEPGDVIPRPQLTQSLTPQPVADPAMHAGQRRPPAVRPRGIKPGAGDPVGTSAHVLATRSTPGSCTPATRSGSGPGRARGSGRVNWTWNGSRNSANSGKDSTGAYGMRGVAFIPR
jgi:hypothetical protein